MLADRKRLSGPRGVATGALRCAAAVGMVSMLMPPLQSGAVTAPWSGGPSISAPTFTPSPRPSPPPVAPGPSRPSGPSYTPPAVYQPSPAELQQRRATAINEQGMTLFKRGDYAGAIRLFEQAFALSTNPNYALIIKHNIAASYSWLTRQAQERGDLDQALRFVELAISYWPDNLKDDWSGWASRLRERIRERQEEIQAAERARQGRAREVAADAERQRAEARAQIKSTMSAEAERRRAETAQKIAEAERQRAEAKQRIAEQLAKTPFAKVDRVAPIEVPVPHLDAKAWSPSFPSEKAPAAFQLSERGLEQMREAKQRSAEWIFDQLKETGKEKAIEIIIEHLPFSEAVNRESQRQHDLIGRYKELYEERAKSATEYVTGFFEVAHDWVACEGAGGSNCAATASANLETVSNKYANQEGERWQSWLREDIRSHGEIQ